MHSCIGPDLYQEQSLSAALYGLMYNHLTVLTFANIGKAKNKTFSNIILCFESNDNGELFLCSLPSAYLYHSNLYMYMFSVGRAYPDDLKNIDLELDLLIPCEKSLGRFHNCTSCICSGAGKELGEDPERTRHSRYR